MCKRKGTMITSLVNIVTGSSYLATIIKWVKVTFPFLQCNKIGTQALHTVGKNT